MVADLAARGARTGAGQAGGAPAGLLWPDLNDNPIGERGKKALEASTALAKARIAVK